MMDPLVVVAKIQKMMRDNLQRMVDHTQKVDLGMFSDSKKGGGKKKNC